MLSRNYGNYTIENTASEARTVSEMAWNHVGCSSH
jgi:hypothetical protein